MKAPTLNEVIQYVKSIGASTDLATIYFDRHQNNGWTVTKLPSAETSWRPERKPMKNWKASVRAYIEQHNRISKNRVYRRA